MGKPKAPAAPDPTATANAQAKYDQNTAGFNAALNRYDVNTPLGSQNWTQHGTDPTTGAPVWSQDINLTPAAQTAFNNTQQTQADLSGLQNKALGGVQSTLNSNPFDQSQIPGRPINPGQTAQQAIMARLQPQQDYQTKQFQAQMANQGIPVGSEAYDAAHRELSQQQNDAQSQAALQGIGLDTQNRQNAISEQGYYANAPLNYLNGLMTGSQVQMPTFQGTPSVMANAPNYQGAVGQQYQGQLNAYNSQMGSYNSMMSGLMNMGGAAAFNLSDRRLKFDIHPEGATPGGIPTYRYRYTFAPDQVYIGVMADEVTHIPGAVSIGADGFARVDYSKIG